VRQPENTLYVHQHSQRAQSHVALRLASTSLGKNRDTADRAADYIACIEAVSAFADSFRISGMAKPQIIKSPLSRVVEEGGGGADLMRRYVRSWRKLTRMSVPQGCVASAGYHVPARARCIAGLSAFLTLSQSRDGPDR
jgi:hypothetical protein